MRILCFFTIGFAFLLACSSVQGRQEEKEESSGSLVRMELKDAPSIGRSRSGQGFVLGGLSGLRFLGSLPNGHLSFLSLTDRGPNAREFKSGGSVYRPFLLPDFQPRIVVLEADPESGSLEVASEIPLLRPDRRRLTGLPQGAGQEIPVDLFGAPLSPDLFGMDPEGIVRADDGTYWVVEEYAPSVAHFSRDGRLLELLKPGKGLPKILEQRPLNRGFEGAALLGDRLYAMLQSPLDNPPGASPEGSKSSRLVRIVEVDLLGKRTLGQYAYLLEGGDRIGDIAMEGPRQLLVLEHNGKAGKKGFRRVVRISLEGVTNLQLLPERIAGPGGTLERMSEAELRAAGIEPAKKLEYVDLSRLGIQEEKIEGVESLDGHGIALIVDNDFGLEGDLNKERGEARMKDEKSALYWIPSPAWVR